MTTAPPRILISVPGAWRSRESIARAIADRTKGRYRFQNGLLETPEGNRFNLDIADYNPRLGQAFADTASDQFTDELLSLINDHSYTLNLSTITGDNAHVDQVMDAGRALLEAGGMALLVVSSGMAHTRDGWIELCEADAPDCFIDAFVQTLEKDRDTWVSLGMHNLALPDAYLEGDTVPGRVGLLVGRFLRYIVENRPDFKEGEFFQFDEKEDPYILSRRKKSEFPPGDPYHNPLGYWQLQQAEID